MAESATPELPFPAGPYERWLPVVSYEGLYEVSDLGRVRSLNREVLVQMYFGPQVRRYRGRILKQYAGPSTHGYPTVGFSRNGEQESRLVHQLVMEAFVGPCPRGQEVRHGRGGKLDARLVNLCYGTRSENIRDRTRDGQDNRGERYGAAKLTWEAVADMRQQWDALIAAGHERWLGGELREALGRKYGVSASNVWQVVTRKTWKTDS